MDAQTRKVPGGLLSVHFYDVPAFSPPSRRSLDLLYLLDGSLQLTVDGKPQKMQKGDIIIVNAPQLYQCSEGETPLLGVIRLDYGLLCHYLGNSRPYFFCNSRAEHSDAYEETRRLARRIFSCQNTGPGLSAIYLEILHYQLLFQLVNNFLLLPEDPRYAQLWDEDSRRRQELADYVDLHYQESLKLSDLAGHFHLSEAYISKYIKKHLGCGFLQYLNRVRLTHAVEELRGGTSSIIRAAFACGFPNVAAFNRLFREVYHMPPSDYLRQFNAAAPAAEREDPRRLTARLENVLQQEPSRQVQEKASPGYTILLDTAAPEGPLLQKSWSSIINIGPAGGLLRSRLQEHACLLRQKLGFSHARIWGVFHKEMHISPDPGKTGHRFGRLDEVLDFLVSNHMHPFLELGSKPIQVIRTLDQYIKYEEPETAFQGPQHMAAFLRAFLRHCIQRYGPAEVGQWHFELWYDRRMDIGQYLDTFTRLAQAVHAESPGTSVGGAGFNISFGTEFIAEFLRSWKKRAALPDFISLYVYQYIPYASNQQGRKRSKSSQVRWLRSTDTHYLKNQLAALQEILASLHFRAPKIYVTEWNSTISSRDVFNDSCYKGAYIMKSLLDSYHLASAFGYWVGSDLFSEGDGSTVLNGGGGLLSQDGICKPAFYAFDFLNRLRPVPLYRDENCLATQDGHGNISIACHNCKPFNFSCYASSRQHLAQGAPQWEQVFENYDPLTLTFRIKVESHRVYRITALSVSCEHGSVLAEWGRLGRPSHPLSGDVDFLINAGIDASAPAQLHGLLKTAKFQAVLIVIGVNLEYLDLQAQHLSVSGFPGAAACPGSPKAAQTPPFAALWAGNSTTPTAWPCHPS